MWAPCNCDKMYFRYVKNLPLRTSDFRVNDGSWEGVLQISTCHCEEARVDTFLDHYDTDLGPEKKRSDYNLLISIEF